jgi:hypothetical protein
MRHFVICRLPSCTIKGTSLENNCFLNLCVLRLYLQHLAEIRFILRRNEHDMIENVYRSLRYDMIYLLTAIGLSAGGSSTVQIKIWCGFDRALSIICGNKMPTRCNRWIFIADLFACSTCFGHHYAHHQELESIIQVFAVCRIWCLVFKLSV